MVKEHQVITQITDTTQSSTTNTTLKIHFIKSKQEEALEQTDKESDKLSKKTTKEI